MNPVYIESYRVTSKRSCPRSPGSEVYFAEAEVSVHGEGNTLDSRYVCCLQFLGDTRFSVSSESIIDDFFNEQGPEGEPIALTEEYQADYDERMDDPAADDYVAPFLVAKESDYFNVFVFLYNAMTSSRGNFSR